jgi:hypothetical protein
MQATLAPSRNESSLRPAKIRMSVMRKTPMPVVQAILCQTQSMQGIPTQTRKTIPTPSCKEPYLAHTATPIFSNAENPQFQPCEVKQAPFLVTEGILDFNFARVGCICGAGTCQLRRLAARFIPRFAAKCPELLHEAVQSLIALASPLILQDGPNRKAAEILFEDTLQDALRGLGLLCGVRGQSPAGASSDARAEPLVPGIKHLLR